MKKYVIEREIPNIGQASDADLKAAAQKSSAALAEIGPGVQWLHSYVTGDKSFCVYAAQSRALIEEHAQISGFPANVITEVKTTIDVTTAG